jgi:hypothetical protein
MQKWEYTSIRETDPDRLVEKLNDLGRAGWELVSCVYTESYFAYVCLFKRPI